MLDSTIIKNGCSITFSQKGMVIQKQNRKKGVIYLLLIILTLLAAITLFVNKYFYILYLKYDYLEILNILLMVTTLCYKNFPKKDLIPYHYIDKINIMNSVVEQMTIVKIETKPGYNYVFQYSYPDMADWDNVIYPLSRYSEEIFVKFASCTFNLDSYK